MYYTVYKTINKINNKFYIGMHKTNNLNDNYLGSGKLLKAAIKKYGKENFYKIILCVCETENDMRIKEKELVVLSDMSYNLCEGGKGGFDFINKNKTKEERSQQGKKCHLLHPDLYNKNLRNIDKKAANKKGAVTKKLKYGEDYFAKLASKQKSELHKQRISDSLKRKNIGEALK